MFLPLGVVWAVIPWKYFTPAKNSTGAYLDRSWVSPCQYSPRRKQYFRTSARWRFMVRRWAQKCKEITPFQVSYVPV